VMTPLRVFIGYDSREDDAYRVCVKSMVDTSTDMPLCIQPLDETKLRHSGLYSRYWYLRDDQRYDNNDDKPFSTAFSFTRFLVPALCQWNGIAMYCDCDFLWRGDIKFLVGEIDKSKAVSVVKHSHAPPDEIKMDGRRQTVYHRKNWSSLIIYNCSHPSNFMLTPSAVNSATGQWLHSFGWLHDHEIGEIDKVWNCLSGIDTNEIQDPFVVHFTNGTPAMTGHENDPYADEWRRVLGNER
jgi:hypothetical protein